MQKDSVQVTENLSLLKKLCEKNPDATHVYLRRADDVLVDVPLSTAIITIRNHPEWTVDDVATATPTGLLGNKASSKAPEGPSIVVPPKPSETAAAAAGAQMDADAGKAPVTAPADGKALYKAQKALEFNGKKYKRSDVIELTPDEAAHFPEGSIKASK